MLGKTHMAVGVAASMLLFQPNTLPELIFGAGAAAIGSVISDIDCSSSESSRRADKIIFAAETIVIGIAAVEAHWHIGLYQKLMSNSSVSRIILACAAFLAICAYGKKTPPFQLRSRISSDAGTLLWSRIPFPPDSGFAESQRRTAFLSLPETFQPRNLFRVRTDQ